MLFERPPRRLKTAMGARFVKWGLCLFIFGVFLTFGIIAHYCAGARWPTGVLFTQNITLWWACPWTLSVAAVQAGGLGMVALGLTRMVLLRLSPGQLDDAGAASLLCCIIGLLGRATLSSMRYGRASIIHQWRR